MTRSLIVALSVCVPSLAAAQGINQTTRSPTTVTQQRQNGAIVAPGAPTQTTPSPNTFRSPFTSPFVPSTVPTTNRNGYAGSGPR